ncbi:hypothetical protein BH05_01955 [Thermobifida fusca]|jgi:hypothetical protein|nr:hypothetical protein [Thermobifida sp.]PPS95787.1 hypothetical protein BH05_01955 [Thermobifida fusca]
MTQPSSPSSPHGPQPPYGSQPYGPPPPPPGQPPHGAQFSPPPYGAGGYPPAPQKTGRNGCLIAGIVVGAAAVLGIAGILVFAALSSSDSTSDQETSATGETSDSQGTTSSEVEGDFTMLPDCSVGEHSELERLVPDYRGEVEDVDTGGQEWWEGQHCSWDNVNSLGNGSYAFLTIMLNDPGERYHTSDDLEWYSQDYTTTEVSGLGEGAVSWYDSENQVGCVATYVANLSFASCYDKVNFGVSLPEEEAIQEAETLARATLEEIRRGDYQ